MGRAFIKEYQQNQCHFSCCGGIMHTTLRYPEHKFLLGGVSISNQFSDFSKSLMIEFMKSIITIRILHNTYTPKSVQSKTKRCRQRFHFNETEADLNKFDKIIDELEPGSCVYL
jgi:hypothetical protein